ncbi:adenylate/guanylate cyclase domain-containing protein [Pendulispora brunnea]|uniref:Adenylate/guanylate cyclase domain-containing protein n=1 Tax=Pendulispora brunnea TaxID=2905690 RepID=A0ABZ2KBF9_9BACT
MASHPKAHPRNRETRRRDGEPEQLKALLHLHGVVDEIVEDGLVHRRNLAEVMRHLLPAVAQSIGAKGAFVASYGEDLVHHVFAFPAELDVLEHEEILTRTGQEKREVVVQTFGPDLVVARPLDVAGEWFGAAGLVFDAHEPRPHEHLADLANMMCEELDNYLYAIHVSREKHQVMMELGVALRHRVLGEGLKQAIAVLGRAVPLGRVLLVYVAEEEPGAALHVQLYEQGELKVDTMMGHSDDDVATICQEGSDYLHDRGYALLERFGFVDAREEVLINGVTKRVVVGKILVTSRNGSFNTYDRELLGTFAGFIRQRVVDFNKEWRHLAGSFRPQDVARLLQSDDYEQTYLAPREEEVAILYVDIAGFTRLSETILRLPSAVAELVEGWSKDAVDLVWKHGGVFDKMVGDCVIALFGPPFYEAAPGERLAAAIRCAIAIREMTRALPQRPQFARLRETGVGVATGVNLAPLFVGTFAPSNTFTGFSSGMNNTARLQGCAIRDEILVMSDAITRLPEGTEFQFGNERTALVKNVAVPLRFRALR